MKNDSKEWDFFTCIVFPSMLCLLPISLLAMEDLMQLYCLLRRIVLARCVSSIPKSQYNLLCAFYSLFTMKMVVKMSSCIQECHFFFFFSFVAFLPLCWRRTNCFKLMCQILSMIVQVHSLGSLTSSIGFCHDGVSFYSPKGKYNLEYAQFW